MQQRPAGRPVPPPYPGSAPQAGPGAGAWPQPTGEPEYFGPQGHGPYRGGDDSPGSTRAFTMGGGPPEDPYPSGLFRPDAPGPDPHQQGHPPYDPYQQPGPDAYQQGGDPYQQGGCDDNVAVYRAGQTTAPPSGPRLHWKELLSGIVLRPQETFWRMRDYPMWGPALLVTFIYGLVAVFGFPQARHDILDASTSTSVPWVMMSGIAFVFGMAMLGGVTNALARQLGGDGAWAPTMGLAMLVTAVTDAPRLLFALFLSNGSGVVQVLGWATWLGGGALLASMVSKSHDLPWPRALGACSIQLVALLILLKLPTISG